MVVVFTVLYTFTFGVGMYFTLRVTRTWPILLHGTTDPSLFLLSGGADKEGAGAAQSALASIAGTANYAVIALAFILVWFIRGRVLDHRTNRGATTD